MSYQSITTLATTDPAQGNAQLTMGSGTSCLVIDTGPSDITEPYFFLYVRLGSGDVKKIKTGRYDRHIIPTEAGDTVAIGSDSARSITVIQYSLPSLATPTGWETATSFSDEAEPRVWTPTSRHIATSTVKKIIILPEVSGWKDIWISDYDGANWSPARWIMTHPTFTPNGVTVPVFGVGVALCTQDGANVQVKLSADSATQGQSHVYELDMPSVTNQVTVTANDGADFLTKLQAATSGTELILPAGTYTVASQITQSDWAQGVTVSGQTGDSDDVTIELSDTNHALFIDGGTTLRGMRHCKIWIDQDHGGVRLRDTKFHAHNVHIDSDGSRAANSLSCDGNSVSQRLFHRCKITNSGGDNVNTDQVSDPILLIDCEATVSGTEGAHQVLTPHQGSHLYAIGGYYADSIANLVATSGETARCCLEFSEYGRGARQSSILGGDMFGCRTSSHFGINQARWVMFLRASGNNANMFRNHDGALESCIFQSVNSDRVLNWLRETGEVSYRHLVFIDCAPAGGEGSVVHNFGNAGTGTQYWENWTIIRGSRAIAVGPASSSTAIARNIIGKDCTVNMWHAMSGVNWSKVNPDYGVAGPPNHAGFTAGANGLKNVTPAIESTLLPTASGNCDNTGDPALYDWIGGRGPTAQPLIYDLGVSSRGALTRPQSGEIFPDVWNAEAVQSSTEQDPDPGEPEGEAPVENVYIARASVRGRQVTAVWQLANTGQSVNGSATGPEINIFNFAGTSITGGRVAMTIENGAFKYEHPTTLIANNQTYLALFYATIAGEERVFPQTLP